jgi:DNA polymerase/3'-5' exonuclease PolX
MSIIQLTQTIHLLPSLPGRSTRRIQQPTLPGMEPDAQEIRYVTNRQIAEALAGIADLLEVQKANPYRIQAYRNAARGILDLSEPAAAILARGEALPIEGLGQRLRAHIAELVQLGTITFQNGLSIPTLPQPVRSLMSIEHVGPFTAIRLYEELGLENVEQVWQAAEHQQIRRLPGFGPRSEERIKRAAERLLPRDRRIPLGGVA